MYESFVDNLREIIQTTANDAVSGAVDTAISNADIPRMVNDAISEASSSPPPWFPAFSGIYLQNHTSPSLVGFSGAYLPNMVNDAIYQFELNLLTGGRFLHN